MLLYLIATFNLFQDIYCFNKREIKVRFRSAVFFHCNKLGWSLYFTIALMTGSLIFSDVQWIWLNCGMFRSVTTLVPLSLFIILSLPAIAIYISFEIALFDNNILTTLQHFLLSQTFFLFKSSKYSLLLFRKSFTHKFLCLV